ncbi:MAG: hypothetical protein AB1806_12830 [Acidobacteriota bacterium]
MQDYTAPSIFFSYGLFCFFLAGGIYFFIRSFKDGYWGRDSEEAKFRMLDDEEADHVRH